MNIAGINATITLQMTTKEKYVCPTITSRVVVSSGFLLEGSIKAEGTDITDVDIDQDPFGVKGEMDFSDSPFTEQPWND